MSIFKAVELSIAANNKKHHTDEITQKELIVRRGQPFTVILKLTQSFQPALHPLTCVTLTGKHPSEEHGTLSYFGIPDNMYHSPSAKAVWKIELKKKSSEKQGILRLAITPPADAPIGEYTLTAKHRDEEMLLALPTVLFNPWCPDDSVFLPDDEERMEYVMNEKGIIFRGSIQFHSPLIWDYGQFEEDMVKICMKLLDVSHKHDEDAAADCSRRCDPVYIGRVVSAMINSAQVNDHGVLEGRWSYPYTGGFKPTHWSGSHDILRRWYKNGCLPVKYGQCWVFAGVMCSVMRLLGIPCRVITNFESAHDTNKNLIIDVYHADYGVREKDSLDSIWNFHVWVEGWMKRPDLAENGKYDGWQVLDPTPQEMSDGQYCCGPAPVKAILNGEVNVQYDVPFVFAEVNADCIDWLVKEDGSKTKIFSDTKRVGADMLTKSAHSTRESLKQSYKHKEGSKEERDVFIYASTLNEAGTVRDTNEVTPDVITPTSSITMRFEEVAEPMNGKDVKLKLVLHSESNIDRELSITISVQVMRHNGTPALNIMKNEMKETLQPGKELSIPVLIPFLTYHQPMLEGESLKVSALVKDQKLPDEIYVAEDNIVLLEPTLSVTTDSREMKLHKIGHFQIIFKNPANEKLTECTLTLSGSGLLRDDTMVKLPDLPPNKQFRIRISCIPYKTGEKTLLADLDCKTFTDIKGNCNVNVIP